MVLCLCVVVFRFERFVLSWRCPTVCTRPRHVVWISPMSNPIAFVVVAAVVVLVW